MAPLKKKIKIEFQTFFYFIIGDTVQAVGLFFVFLVSLSTLVHIIFDDI